MRICSDYSIGLYAKVTASVKPELIDSRIYIAPPSSLSVEGSADLSFRWIIACDFFSFSFIAHVNAA